MIGVDRDGSYSQDDTVQLRLMRDEQEIYSGDLTVEVGRLEGRPYYRLFDGRWYAAVFGREPVEVAWPVPRGAVELGGDYTVLGLGQPIGVRCSRIIGDLAIIASESSRFR